MKELLKRLGSLALALLMVASLLPVSAFAEETTEAAPVADTTNVAKIGDTEYESLADALDAAVADDIVTLLDDVSDVDVTIKQAITLDLGGKTITDAYIKTTANVTIQNGFIKNTNEPYPLVVNGGELTVEDVAIEASKSDRAIWLRNSGTVLHFNSGSILATKGENNTKTTIYGVWVCEGATANINGGSITVDAGENATAVAIYGNYENTVNITGGKISTSGKTYSYAVHTNGDVTVSGGEIVTNEKGYCWSSGITYGKNYAINTKGNVEITGGKITTNGPSGYLVYAGGSNQTVTISDVEFTNVLTETDKTAGGASAPNLIYGSSVTAEITGGDFNGVIVDEALITEGANVTIDGKEMIKTENGLEKAPDPVAKIGDTGYETLQAAIDAVKDGETITLQADCAETVSVNKSNVAFTIDGNKNTMTGKIQINIGQNLTVKNVNFVWTEDAAHDFIANVGSPTGKNYNTTLLVEDCTFTGNGKDNTVAVRTIHPTHITIQNSTGTGLHSFLQNTGGQKVEVRNVTIIESKGGLALGTTPSITVRGCDITTRTYGIRLDATLDASVTLNGNTVNAYIPVSVRKATATNYQLNFAGTQSMTATNPDGVWCAICATEYEDGAALNDATGNVKVAFTSSNLSADGIYGAYEWPVEVVYGDGYTKGFDSLSSAMSFGYSGSTEKTIVVHENITESMDSLEGNIVTDNPNGVTIKNTIIDEWIYCSEDFTIGEGVTYDATGYASGLFMYADNAVINGTVLTDCYYQRYADTKLTINEPGSMTVKTETFILRYTDGDADAGIYIVGDNDDSTVGLTASVIYFYQGMINAKDADIVVGTYWQTNETDGTGSANLVMDNSNMTVTVSEHKMKATGTSTVTLTNDSHVSVAGGYEGVTASIDATSSLTQNGVSVYAAKVGDAVYATVADAFAAAKDGDEVVILQAGTYALSTSGKNITVTGAVDGVVFAGMGAYNMGGASVTFNNVTFNWTNANYTGLQHSGDLVYNNCTINGQPFLYGTSETFNKCTFNQTSKDAYNVWTYSAKEVAFNECTFNSAGKSVLIYHESASVFNDVAVTACEFNASETVSGKAAIEMDSSLTAGIKLTIDDATTAEGFDTNTVSGNSLWNNKKGNSTDANNDITVVVAGETVLGPVTFVAKIGTTGYTSIADAIKAAQGGDTVTVLAGEYTTDIAVNKDITVVGETDAEGNNLVMINGGIDITADGATVKNLTASDPATSGYNSTLYINAKDVLVEGCVITDKNATRYCETTGTVTFRDCTITGSTYGIHFDSDVSGNIVIENCVITGWTSFASTITKVTIEDTTFAEGNYNQLRLYQDAELTNVTFNPKMTIDFGTENVEAAFNGCSVTDGSDLTEVIYLPDIAEMGVKVTIDDEPVVIVAKVGDNYYMDLQAAIEAAGEGETITLIADVTVASGETIVLDNVNLIAGEGITLTNNGAIKVSGASDIAANVTGSGWFYMNGVSMTADTKLYGAKVAFVGGTNNIVGSTITDGFFSVGIGQDAAAEAAVANGITLGDVTVNVSNDAVIGGNGKTYSGWVGSAYSADKTQYKYVLNIENSLATFGYMHVSKDGALTVKGHANNKYTNDGANVDFYAGELIVNGTVTLDGTDAWAKFAKISVDHADGVLNIVNGTNFEASIHNGSNTGTSLKFWKSGKFNVDATSKVEIDNGTVLTDGAELNIAGSVIAKGAVTGNGTITLTATAATFTAAEGLTVGTDVADYKVAYADGIYKVVAKVYVAQVGEQKFESLDDVLAAPFSGNVTVELLKDVSTDNVVKTNSLRTYNFVTNVEGGVTMNLNYADNWNYFRYVNIGKGVTVKAKYLVFSYETEIAGTIDAYYPYINGGKVTVTETGVLKYEGGDGLQVKGAGASLTVNGTVIAPTINVWKGDAKLIVSGENAKIESNWIDIWDGAPSVVIENGATVDVDAIKVSRGGTITVDDATLDTDNLQVGHNGNSAGVVTVVNGGQITKSTLTAVGSTITGPEGMKVVSGVEGYMVAYENGVYKLNVPVKVSNGKTTKYYATIQEAVTACPKYYTITLTENYNGPDLKIATTQQAATDGITIDLNGYELNANIKVDDIVGKTKTFNLNIKNGTINGNITTVNSGDVVMLTNVTVKGTITANSTVHLKTGTAVTGSIVLQANGALKFAADATVNGYQITVANVQDAEILAAMKIEAAAYVLNYQSKGVFGFYGSVEGAAAATAKYYTLVLMKDATLTETINTTAKATLKRNGFAINDENLVGGNLTIKD